MSKVVIVLVQGLQDPIIFPKSKTDTFSPGARAAFKSWFLIVFGFSGFQDSGFLKFLEDLEVKSCLCVLFVCFCQIHKFFLNSKDSLIPE